MTNRQFALYFLLHGYTFVRARSRREESAPVWRGVVKKYRRIIGLVAVVVLAQVLGGCASLGMTQLDRAELESRYTNETTRFVEVDGVRVHTRSEGQGPTVLLLHGVMASLHTWDGWVEALADRYRFIRIDVPGFGLSDPAPSLEDEAILRLVNGVLDAYGVERAVVVGNSLGGYIAALYAAHEPGRVQALTLISPAGYPQPMPWLLRMASWPVIGKPFEWATPRPVVRHVLNDVYGDAAPVTEATVERYFELNRARGNRKATRAVLREMAERRDQKPAWVSKIEAPTLLLWGELDNWVPVELADQWLEDVRHAELIRYPEAGHVAMEEIPQISAADFDRFASRVLAEE